MKFDPTKIYETEKSIRKESDSLTLDFASLFVLKGK
jgi:hypothetical protein